MLSKEQEVEIKEKIIAHIESTFPKDQIESAINKVEAMNSEQLENFLQKNNAIKEDSKEECVFCSIVADKIKACKIGENEQAIAILEINPISKGHCIILARSHVEEPQEGVIKLAEKIANLIKKRLKSKEVKVSQSRLFGHELVNVLPVYSGEDFNSEKKQVSFEELEAIKQELEMEPEKKKRTRKVKEKLWLPKRIP